MTNDVQSVEPVSNFLGVSGSNGKAIVTDDVVRQLEFAWDVNADITVLFNASSMEQANRIANAFNYFYKGVGSLVLPDEKVGKLLKPLITRKEVLSQDADLEVFSKPGLEINQPKNNEEENYD